MLWLSLGLCVAFIRLFKRSRYVDMILDASTVIKASLFFFFFHKIVDVGAESTA